MVLAGNGYLIPGINHQVSSGLDRHICAGFFGDIARRLDDNRLRKIVEPRLGVAPQVVGHHLGKPGLLVGVGRAAGHLVERPP